MKLLDKRNKNNLFLFGLFCVILLGIIGYSLHNQQSSQILKDLLNTDNLNDIEDQGAQENLDDADGKMANPLPGIICWGDSLTAGAGGEGVTFPLVLAKSISDNYADIPVVNCGVGGEDTNTIIGRAGGVPFVTTEKMTIPANTSQVVINFASANGAPVAPLKQGDCGINPVNISGVEGYLLKSQEKTDSGDYVYMFSRGVEGDPVQIESGEIIVTSATVQYENYISVIFIGQNGGWSDPEDLIAQQMSIINNNHYDQEKFIILGLTSGNEKDRTELETALSEYYGDKFINLRQYLSSNGMNDAGLVPTEQDLEAMKIGSVPPSLLSDAVHLNAYGYTLIGNLVYERIRELFFFEQ